MAPPADHPQVPAERLISRTIQSTWILYAIGGLYIAGPVLGWTLAFMAARALYLAPGLPEERRPRRPGRVILLWLAGMLAMLMVLLVGHATNGLDAGQTIKSATGWAKGWALLALFPFAGAVLEIRPAVIYRATCRLGLQTLILLPLFLAAPRIGLPGQLYVSPLQILGGSGPEYFSVMLYTLDPEFHIARWQFFAPWSPAAGMVAVIYILCAIEERDWRWKAAGIASGLALALFSQSRLALVAIAMVWPLAHLVARANKPVLWFAFAPGALAAGFFATDIQNAIGEMMDRFKGARVDSSRVRAALGRIAVNRWESEAPWFGHGIVERGPHMVEYMPIGSHHTWYGLLFVKGALGALSLAVPMLYSLASLAWHASRGPIVRVGFSMLLVLFLYSFGENLEVLGYLYWPALILIGCAARTIGLEGAPRSAAISA